MCEREENGTLRFLLNSGTNTITNTLNVTEDLEISIKKWEKYQYKYIKGERGKWDLEISIKKWDKSRAAEILV